jgi:hypothetical protein
MFNTESVPQIILTNPSKLRIYLCDNFYCDHRNFDSVKPIFATEYKTNTYNEKNCLTLITAG